MKLKNYQSKSYIKGRTKVGFIIAGFIIGLIFLKSGKAVISYTSSDKYCVSCHIHPMADQSWKLSAHFNNRTGNIVPYPPNGRSELETVGTF